jgi:7-cyano-7-deazaguanine synthase
MESVFMTKAIVLVSGGIDSTIALWWVMRKDWEPIPLTFDYFARAKAEKSATRLILRKAGIEHFIEVPLESVKEVHDLAKEGRVPRTLKDAPEGYIPARNMIFYSIAAYYAEVFGAEFIVGGHNKGDPEEFPDSNPSFFRQMNGLLKMGLWSYRQKAVKILTPLRYKTKPDVVRLGLRLGAPLGLTWSCRFDAKKPCGKCSSCIERDHALSSADIGPSRRGK